MSARGAGFLGFRGFRGFRDSEDSEGYSAHAISSNSVCNFCYTRLWGDMGWPHRKMGLRAKSNLGQ